MTNNNDDFIIKALQEKYKKTLEKYNSLKNQLGEAQKNLNKCIYAINVWSDEDIELIGEKQSIPIKEANNIQLKDVKQHEVLVYDSSANIKAKIIRILQIYDRAMSKSQIIEFICQQEPDKDPKQLGHAFATPIHLLNKDGVLAQSKVKGIKMKGSFYGKPEWLVQDGIWKAQHKPIINKKQNIMWE